MLANENSEKSGTLANNSADDCFDQDQQSTDQFSYSKSDRISEPERSSSVDGSFDDLSTAMVDGTHDSTVEDQPCNDQSFRCKSNGNNNGTPLFYNITSLNIYNVSTITLTSVAPSESQTIALGQTHQPDSQADTRKYPMFTNSPRLLNNNIDMPSLSPNNHISELINKNTTDDCSCMTSISSCKQIQSNTKNLSTTPLQINLHQIPNNSLANDLHVANGIPTCEINLFLPDLEPLSPDNQPSDLPPITKTPANQVTATDAFTSLTNALSVLIAVEPSILDKLPLPPPNVDVHPSSSKMLNSTSDNLSTSDCGNETEAMHVCHIPDCGRVFDRSWMLKRHLTIHSDKNEFSCAHCDAGFVCKDALAVHVQEHMNKEQEKCQCPNCSVEGGNNTKDPYTDKPQHMCHIPGCGQVFCYESNLKWHLDWHSDKQNFFCAYCDKGFLSKNALRLHVIRHMDKDEREKCRYPSSLDYEVSEFCQVTEILSELIDKNGEKSSSSDAEHSNPPADNPNSSQTRFENQDPLLSSESLQTLEDTPGPANLLIPEEESSQKLEPTSFEDPCITADFLLSELTKTFPCEICNKRFARRYELRTHMNMHKHVPNPFHLEKKKYKWTRCKCPNCCAEGDNKVRAPNGKLMHVCHISHCGRVFTGTDSLKRHLELHSSKKNDFSKYVCRFSNCKKVFSQPRYLELHMSWHSAEKNFFCAHCNKGFSSKFQLVSHSKLHMKPKSKKSRCKNKTGNESTLSEGKPQLACLMPGCRRIFTQIRSLKAHLKTHSKEKKFICAYCDEGFAIKQQLVSHVKAHINPQSGNFQDLHCKAENVCNYCGRAYWQYASLFRHIQQTHKEDNKDDVVAELQEYLTIKTDKPEYLCHVPGCGRSFKQSWILKRHKNDHSDEKKFYCAHCEQGFARKVQLILHMKPHMNPRSRHFQGVYCEAKGDNENQRTKDKPQHICHIPNCGRVFWQRGALIAHLRKFHSDEENIEPTYVCQILGCEKAFARAGQLDGHMKWHTSGRENFICDHCNKEFSCRDSMIMHMKMHMPDSKKDVCHIQGCERVYKPVDFRRHLEWHNGKKYTRKIPKYLKQEKLANITIDSTVSPTPSRPKRASCKCPNCSVDGGNKTKDSKGRPLHICHHPYCGKVFCRPGNLNLHLDSHADKNNFVQPVSDKEFARIDALVDNYDANCKCPNCSVDGGNTTRDSKGRILHACYYADCGKAFCRKRNLKSHLDWHRGKENFLCAHCPKRFTLKSALSRHVTLHMNEQFGPQYTCHIPGCGRTYNLNMMLNRHLATHNGKTSFICTHCDKRFAGKVSLNMHLKVHKPPKQKNLQSYNKSKISSSANAVPKRELVIKLTKCEIPPRLSLF